jgi:DNA-binding transcriptional ArsR family regulator
MLLLIRWFEAKPPEGGLQTLFVLELEYMLYFYNMSSNGSHDLIFKALADSRRRKLLDLLKDKPKTTSELCEEFADLDRCTVMQHLGVLERAGLIIVRKKGRFRWNYLDVAPIREIYDRWINQYASPSVELLTKIKRDMSESVP